MSATNKPVVIKKVKKVIGGGHHGGAWKVAYADFVTAMMAFFLLMWLINTTSPEQKRGIADYFAPASVSRSTQGSDGLLGGTAFQEDGARASGANVQIQVDPASSATNRRTAGGASAGENAGEASSDALASALARRTQGAEFASAEASIRQALQDMPDFAELSKNIMIDQTPEGLRIQLIDQEGRAMFSGASADRANAARRILTASGLPPDRIYQVTGKADQEPLYPDDPDQPGNRRISIVLLREAPVLPADHAL